MAIGTVTISLIGRPGRDLTGKVKTIQGTIVLSANSAFNTSKIERYFNRCTNINLNVAPYVSGYIVKWHRSATHKAGAIKVFAMSAVSVTAEGPFLQSAFTVPMSGSFDAIGI